MWSNSGWQSDEGIWYKNKATGGSLPIATFQSGLSMTGSGVTQTATVSLPGTGQSFVVVAFSGNAVNGGNPIVSVTVASAGGTGTLSLTVKDASPEVAIYQGTMPVGSNSDTSATVTLTYNANPFGNTILNLWTVPAANILSTTAVTGSLDTTGTITAAANLSTTSGGFIIVAGRSSDNTGGQTITASGTTETLITDFTVNSGITAVGGHVNGIATNASNSVAVNFSTSANLRMAAAAWR